MSNWQLVLLEPAKTVLTQIGQFLVNALLVVIILIIGWVISKLIRTLVTRVLRAVKLDELSDRIEYSCHQRCRLDYCSRFIKQSGTLYT